LHPNTAPYSIANQLGGTRTVSRGRVWFLVAVLACAAVAARVSIASRAAVQAGLAALERADERAAVRDFQRAVRLFVPGSPFVEQAIGQLRGVAEAAAARGDRPAELRAWMALRGGLLGARSLYTPFPAQLTLANQRLAALYAGQDVRGALADGVGGVGDEAWHLQRLARRPGPGPGTTALALLGFGAWLGAAVVFTRRGIDRTLALRRNWALACLVGFVLGLTAFVSSFWLV
jgi:hypothetical protein